MSKIWSLYVIGKLEIRMGWEEVKYSKSTKQIFPYSRHIHVFLASTFCFCSVRKWRRIYLLSSEDKVHRRAWSQNVGITFWNGPLRVFVKVNTLTEGCGACLTKNLYGCHYLFEHIGLIVIYSDESLPTLKVLVALFLFSVVSAGI